MPRDLILCDSCTKMRRGNHKKMKCAVLRGRQGKNDTMPFWGPECAAYSDDPLWLEKANRAGDEYQARKGGRQG